MKVLLCICIILNGCAPGVYWAGRGLDMGTTCIGLNKGYTEGGPAMKYFADSTSEYLLVNGALSLGIFGIGYLFPEKVRDIWHYVFGGAGFAAGIINLNTMED